MIWLIDYDGKIPNLALMRLATYYKDVTLKHGDAYPELFEKPDKVFISCIFRWNKEKAENLAYSWSFYADVELGGTGVDISKCLPEDIQNCEPDYSLYDYDKALGFISRGCIRKCPWCFVPEKEGILHRVSTAQEIVGNFKEAIFLDNNFLALPDYETDLLWLAENRIKIDFNQGLDARLVTPKAAELLSKCRWSNYIRFSLDSDSQIKSVERAIKLLGENGIKSRRIVVFVLIGMNGFESDAKRLLFCNRKDVVPRPMRYIDMDGKKHSNGWDAELWRKFPRLIWRYYHSDSVWELFRDEIQKHYPWFPAIY